MKKIYILLTLVTGLVFARAQQTGVNTTTPQATLDVTATTDNTTADVEGLLIPRVNKEKALLMAASTPEESTLIYVNDLTLTSTADATVGDVTENGYYHWNGAKWVKHSGKDGSEWVYDATTERVNLKRSFEQDFDNKIYYDGITGNFINSDVENFNVWNGTEVVNYAPEYNSLQNNYAIASNIEGYLSPYKNEQYKQIEDNYMILDVADVGGLNHRRISSLNQLIVNADNTQDYGTIRVSENRFESFGGSGFHKNVHPLWSSLIYRSGSTSVERGAATRGETYFNSTGTANQLYGALNDVRIEQNAGNVNEIFGTHSSASALSNLTVSKVTGNRAIVNVNELVTVNTLIGSSVINDVPTTNNVVDNYGLYLSNVNNAQNNWAIYTNAGLNSFGDDVQVRNINTNTSTEATDKVVVADADGVLKTKDATAFAAENAEWVYDAATERINLKRSGNTPFENEVYYDKNGGFNSIDFLNFKNYDRDLAMFVDVNVFDSYDAKSNFNAESINLPLITNVSNGGTTYNRKRNKVSILKVKEPVALPDFQLHESINFVTIDPDNNSPTRKVQATSSYVAKNDNLATEYLVANSSEVRANFGSITGYITANRSETVVDTSSNVSSATSNNNYLTINSGATSIDKAIIETSGMYFRGENTNINEAKGNNVAFYFSPLSNMTIEELVGYDYLNSDKSNFQSNIANHIGIRLGDVDLGTQSNHAIYTNAGLNSFGDDVQIRNINTNTSTEATDKVVVADADGVLKTKDATALVAENSEWKDGTNANGDNLIYANQANAAGKEVVITDDGKLGIGNLTPKYKLDLVTSGIDTDYVRNSIGITSYRNAKGSAGIDFLKARGTIENPLKLEVGDYLGGYHTSGFDGQEFIYGSRLSTIVEDEVSTGIMPVSFKIDLANDGEYNNKFIIKNNGNIGIGGATNPQVDLAIGRNYFGLDYILNEGLFLTQTGTSENVIGIKSIGSIEISSDSNANFSTPLGRFEGIAFKTSQQDRMRITENGNIGIGTITPTEKLEVAGNIKADNATFKNLPIYNSDAAADADTTLESGSLYQLTTAGRQVFVKP